MRNAMIGVGHAGLLNLDEMAKAWFICNIPSPVVPTGSPSLRKEDRCGIASDGAERGIL